MDNIKTLLKNVKTIIDEHQQISYSKEDDFNIFKVLRLERDEEKLHSRLIADLINPKGQNQLWKPFLSKFLDQVHNNKIEINSENLSVVTEKPIGNITQNYCRGGKIDIYITDGINHIAIETKIDAVDQPHQLYRYYNFLIDECKRSNGDCSLIYLTLNGCCPSNQSVKCNGDSIAKNVIPISFCENIYNWLKSCLETEEVRPYLKASLKQYLILLENLKFKNKVMDELKKDLITSKLIFENYWNTRLKAIKEFYNAISENYNSYFVSTQKEQFWKDSSLYRKLKFENDYFVIEIANGRNDFYVAIWTDNANRYRKICDKSYISKEKDRLKKIKFLKRINTGDIYSEYKNISNTGLLLIQDFHNGNIKVEMLNNLVKKFNDEFEKINGGL